MIFNSFQFLWLFPLIFIAYYLVMWIFGKKSNKLGNYLLIAISYGLYMQWESKYALVLVGVTAITYVSALLIECHKAYGRMKYLVFAGASLALLPLLVFKYTDFVLQTFQNVLGGGQFH